MRCVAVLIVLATATAQAATPVMNAQRPLPAEQFNVDGQHRTRTCAEMKGARVPLRFADGTPNGFFARADDPSKQGGEDAKPCPAGCIEIDAHEIITTAGGMKLYFHPGGGPDHYEDHVANGQYGHVALEDLKAPPPKLKVLDLNGKPTKTDYGPTYLITPTRIPRDMWYKPNVNEKGRSGSTYFTYANPGYDKTRGRGDFTYINWSWVQNGGDKYPENICRGGGMVRAIGKRGMQFTAANVAPIMGYSYGADNKINGRVTAIYGRTTAGPGDGGSELFGWIPHSYQMSGDVIVPCVRRAPAVRLMETPQAASADRAVRMARNLLHETTPDPAARAALLKQLAGERDAQARMELLTALSRMDDAETVSFMLKLLREDKDARVRVQAIALLGFLRSTFAQLEKATAELTAHQKRAEDAREKERIAEVLEKFKP